MTTPTIDPLTRTNVKPNLYFPGLNGLRFIAAFSVLISHVEYFILGQKGKFDLHILKILGASGVDLFFVISGYLITYLLLMEKGAYKKINLKKFYLRRILRIWPLYYLILIITVFIIPSLFTSDDFNNGYTSISNILLFVFFLPFVSLAISTPNFMAAVLWSIGVEEVYYIFWPLIINIRAKISIKSLISMLLCFLTVKAVITYLPYKIKSAHNILTSISDVLVYFRIEFMIVGSIMAYIAMNMPNIQRVIQNKVFFLLSLVSIFIYLFIGFDALYFGLNPIVAYMIDPVIFALLCGVLVINMTHNKSLSDPLEHRLIYNLGQISFGLYVYHSTVIFILMRLFVGVLALDPKGMTLHILLLVSACIMTIGISYLSYHYFEKPFLSLKKRFTIIVSGNEAREETGADSDHPVVDAGTSAKS